MADLLPYLPLLVLLLSVFAGALVSSFAGFAFSPVAGVALLYFFPHHTVVPFLMLCSVVVQMATLVYLRRNLVWTQIGPMLVGGAAGVALAIVLFKRVDSATFEVGFGLFLALYSTVMLWRPQGVWTGASSRTQDTAVGFAGGMVGGFTAMPGAVPVIYCDLRGLSKECQRATVQPFILAMQVLALTMLVLDGDIGGEVVISLFFAFPALAAGVALGLALFGRVPDAQFRQAILGLLLVSGLALAL
jgi:uncharacterized protein